MVWPIRIWVFFARVACIGSLSKISHVNKSYFSARVTVLP